MSTGRLGAGDTAIQPTIFDAKGDLLTATAGDTPARIAVGNSGETLVADSSATTGLRWQGNYAAGKNAIINGDFGIWQRGTSFSNPASAAFTADRWSVVWDGSGATRTISQQSFTAGSAPVAGYEGRFFYRFNQSVAGTGGTYNLFQNRMEDVRTFAGQTITISFWGKAAANTNLVKLNLEQEFGTGGSPSAGVSTDIANTNFTLTTSWQRFSVTTTVPSISGKTVGTTTPGFLGLRFWIPVNSTFTIDIWGVQVEAGSVATAFQTATGTFAGELAACQRYYQKTYALATIPGDNASALGMVYYTRQAASGNVEPTAFVRLAPSMRTAPSITLYNPYSGTAGQWSDGTTSSANARAFNAVESSLIIDNTDVTINVQNAGIQYVASAEL